MSTVTGIEGVRVAIPVTVVAFGPSDPSGVWTLSRVIGIAGIAIAILVTANAFGSSDRGGGGGGLKSVNSHQDCLGRVRDPRN